MQWLRWLSEGRADNVPDLSRHRRRNHVHAWTGQRHPENFAMAREWQRPAGVGRIGCGVEQLFVVQRLHARVPVERQSGIAKGGIALCRDSKTWAWFT